MYMATQQWTRPCILARVLDTEIVGTCRRDVVAAGVDQSKTRDKRVTALSLTSCRLQVHAIYHIVKYVHKTWWCTNWIVENEQAILVGYRYDQLTYQTGDEYPVMLLLKLSDSAWCQNTATQGGQWDFSGSSVVLASPTPPWRSGPATRG